MQAAIFHLLVRFHSSLFYIHLIQAKSLNILCQLLFNFFFCIDLFKVTAFHFLIIFTGIMSSFISKSSFWYFIAFLCIIGFLLLKHFKDLISASPWTAQMDNNKTQWWLWSVSFSVLNSGTLGWFPSILTPNIVHCSNYPTDFYESKNESKLHSYVTFSHTHIGTYLSYGTSRPAEFFYLWSL